MQLAAILFGSGTAEAGTRPASSDDAAADSDRDETTMHPSFAMRESLLMQPLVDDESDGAAAAAPADVNNGDTGGEGEGGEGGADVTDGGAIEGSVSWIANPAAAPKESYKARSASAPVRGDAATAAMEMTTTAPAASGRKSMTDLDGLMQVSGLGRFEGVGIPLSFETRTPHPSTRKPRVPNPRMKAGRGAGVDEDALFALLADDGDGDGDGDDGDDDGDDGRRDWRSVAVRALKALQDGSATKEVRLASRILTCRISSSGSGLLGDPTPKPKPLLPTPHPKRRSRGHVLSSRAPLSSSKRS